MPIEDELMAIVVGVLGFLFILIILWDAFEVIILPRRVSRNLRFSRIVFISWRVWATVFVRRIRARGRRDAYMGFIGPLAVLVLLGCWAVGLIVGFGMLQWAFGSRLAASEGGVGFGTILYMSGTTFFTLGLGDVVPRSAASRVLVVAEAGLGFGFLAMVISYLPVLYQAFSRREARISLLDAWAGTPSSAGELLRRLGTDDCALLGPFLKEWEQWSAELLETHVSYPVLAFFRSQHDNQSWVGALTTVLDACALVIACVEGAPLRMAELTFAMARHVGVDLCQVLTAPPRPPDADRLPPADLQRLIALLRDAGVAVRDDPASLARLQELRAMYEPYVYSLADRVVVDLPRWLGVPGARDNWQKSAWR